MVEIGEIMDEIKMGEHQSREIESCSTIVKCAKLDADCEGCQAARRVLDMNQHTNAMAVKKVKEQYKQIQQLQADKKELERVITKAISGLEYAAFNLTKLKKVEKLPPGIMESTGPEDTLLIELRDLKRSTKEG